MFKLTGTEVFDIVRLLFYAAVAESVYATDSKSVARKGLRVRVPPAAPGTIWLRPGSSVG